MPRKSSTPTAPIVYAIVHLSTGRLYIGSTIRQASRWTYHRGALKHRRHENGPLQIVHDQEGLSALEFRVLEHVESGSLIAAEQRWIDLYRDTGRLLNLSMTAGSTRSISDEQARAVKQRLTEGIHLAQVAREMAIPVYTAGRIARGELYSDIAPELDAQILVNRPNGRVVARKPSTKLTPDDVRAIRVRLARGERAVDIARDFGVSEGLIGHIKRRLAWDWLP